MSVKEWPAKTQEYLKEVQVEMQKVSWPNRQSVIGSTVAVLAAVVALSAFIWVIDGIYGKILEQILK